MKENNISLARYDAIPAHKAVLRNAAPAIVGSLMQLVYNLADTFFIGLTGDDLQVAAVSLAFPVFMLFMAFGLVFGIGGTSVISRAYGEGRNEYAKKVSSFCMWASIATGVVMSLIFYVFMDDILRAVGANADTLEYTRDYLLIVVTGVPLSLSAARFQTFSAPRVSPARR
jgi:Na+-driven multidrug efflux pump